MYLDLILDHLPKNGLVLDAGCGDENFTASLHDAGISVIGLDGNPEAIACASQRYPSIKFFRASVYDDITTTPYWGYLMNVLMAITNQPTGYLPPSGRGGHIKHFSYRTLRTLLESRGFEVISFHGAGRRIRYCWNGMMMVARKRVKD